MPKSNCKNALAPNGKYVTVDGQGITKVRSEDLNYLKDLIETGKNKIGYRSALSVGTNPRAHRYAEQGHKKGKCRHHGSTGLEFLTKYAQCSSVT